MVAYLIYTGPIVRLADLLSWIQYFNRRAYAVSKLWVFQDTVQKKVDDFRSKLVLEGPVCGFHVRRGDKINVEARLVNVTEYLKAAVVSSVPCKTCFIASDDLESEIPNFASALPEFFPDCSIQYIPASGDSKLHGHSQGDFVRR